MSRPPYMQAPHENPHNGGLIDFHDGVLMADAVSSMYAQAAAAKPMQQNMYHGMTPAGLAQPMPPAFGMQPGYAQAGFAPQMPPGAMMVAQSAAQCIAGPPAFVHLHGQVYRPVEESFPASAIPEAVATPVVKEPANPQSTNSIERMVEQRVEQRVEEFLAKTGKNKGMSRSTSKKGKGESLQQESLKSLNQKMRARL